MSPKGAAAKSYKSAEAGLIACAKQVRIVKDNAATPPGVAEVTQGEILAQAAGLGYALINDLALGERPLNDALVELGKISKKLSAIASGPEPMFTPKPLPPGPVSAAVLGAERQAVLRRHVLQLLPASAVDPLRP